MIIVDNIAKSYGAQELFKDAGFRLNARERVGLVGRNGHGKTTLFRLIIGEEEVRTGTVILRDMTTAQQRNVSLTELQEQL